MPDKGIAPSVPPAKTLSLRSLQNIRLVLEFDGSGFAGWQYQPHHRTVQGELQAALTKLLGEHVTVYGCSRTDAGVSARNYVANFQTSSRLTTQQICRALNFHLPREILIKHAELAPVEFHARYSAKSKTYRYFVVLGRSPLRASRYWEFRLPVQTERLCRALQLFSGRHDFGNFCHLHLPSRPAYCTLYCLDLLTPEDELIITIRGDRFLYKMVRRIVGAAVAYGASSITLTDIRAALAGHKHRPFPTAPSHGLVLESVEY